MDTDVNKLSQDTNKGGAGGGRGDECEDWQNGKDMEAPQTYSYPARLLLSNCIYNYSC